MRQMQRINVTERVQERRKGGGSACVLSFSDQPSSGEGEAETKESSLHPQTLRQLGPRSPVQSAVECPVPESACRSPKNRQKRILTIPNPHDSVVEESASSKDGKVTPAKNELEFCGSTSSSKCTLSTASAQADETQNAEKTEVEAVTLSQGVTQGYNVVSESSKDTATSIDRSDISRPPKKRGRPLMLSSSAQKGFSDFSRSHSKIATAFVLAAAASPRRQSSRLHPPLSSAGSLGRRSGKNMSHRTCQYCGAVKPTPAALQRHIRKHTGERPFVCQVCQKAYKAKRSLHCHQITNHPELLNGTNNVVSSVDSAGTRATVSSSTSNLLRETLQTRRMARQSIEPDFAIVPEFPHSSQGTGGIGIRAEAIEGSEQAAMTQGHNPQLKEQSTGASSYYAGASQDLGVSVATLNSSSDAADMSGDESGDLSRRSCSQCHKVFIKPSDLKRHLMVHTGERPFVCEYCHKGFKQPGSLNYHLKATHNVDIPLSQGLEERYLRLKTRSALRSLAVMDSWNARFDQDGNGVLPVFKSLLPVDNCAEADSEPELKSGARDGEAQHGFPLSVPASFSPCSSFTPSLRHALTRQMSHTSEGSWSEDHGYVPNIVEVELPHFGLLDGNSSDGVSFSPRKIHMVVKKEVMLFTQLNGVCARSGQPMQVFRCCLCEKLCASMYLAVSHLTAHFENKQWGFECRLCKLVFNSQPEMVHHFQQKHNLTLNDLDLQNNNLNVLSLNSKNGEEKVKAEAQSEPADKGVVHLDDHNNNNGSHINKEFPAALSEKGSFSPQTSSLSKLENKSNAIELSSSFSLTLPHIRSEASSLANDLEARESFQHLSKCTYRCPKCSKCYLTQFLLDRHLAFHKRQSLIEAVWRSDTRVNGAHKDLLLHPPPVLPQDSDKFQQLKELSVSWIKEEGLNRDLSKEDDQVENRAENFSDEGSSFKELAEKVNCHSQVLDTKALLDKEGIQEGITVVMPSDPDFDKDTALVSDSEISSEVKDNLICESEIRCAPKRHLIPFKNEAIPAKSRRKSSLPTRFRSATRESETSAVPCSSSPSPEHSSEQQPQESTTSTQTEQQDLSSVSPSCSGSPRTFLDSSPEADEISKEFHRELLRAQQTSYIQSLHAAFASVPPSLLGAAYPGNGLTSAASLTMATAGYLRPFPQLSGQTPFSLHGSSVSNPHPLTESQSSTPRSLSPRKSENRVEDLSFLSTSVTSPSSNLSNSRPSASALSSDPENLVGYPRVLWDPPPTSGGAEGSPSPPISTSEAVNGKHLNPVWHTLSSEDLSAASTTDGRKVTSLSRTHSRLYVVNQPVDRERICKPTVLRDGRTVFRCIFCHKDFLSYSDINRHMDFHEDIRPYKCNFCDYYARTNSQLKVHMMRHQGIREYCCRLCNYRGVTQSDLNRHMKSQIHLLKSCNECNKCGEGFVTPKNLEKHLFSGCDGTHKMDIKQQA